MPDVRKVVPAVHAWCAGLRLDCTWTWNAPRDGVRGRSLRDVIGGGARRLSCGQLYPHEVEPTLSDGPYAAHAHRHEGSAASCTGMEGCVAARAALCRVLRIHRSIRSFPWSEGDRLRFCRRDACRCRSAARSGSSWRAGRGSVWWAPLATCQQPCYSTGHFLRCPTRRLTVLD